jgi:hypothetical protein
MDAQRRLALATWRQMRRQTRAESLDETVRDHILRLASPADPGPELRHLAGLHQGLGSSCGAEPNSARNAKSC